MTQATTPETGCCAVPGTIGALEAQAGIAPDGASRFAFWIAFKTAPDPIAAGVAELRARIAAMPHSADADRAIPKE